MATQPKTKAKLTLADLTDEERRSLLEQAREASKRNPRDVDGYGDLSEREQTVRDLMDARDHARGCPVQEGAELGRVEGYDARRPPDPVSGAPEKWLGVVRCVNCGGSTVLDESLEAAITAHNDQAAAALEDAGGDATLT